MIVPGAKDTDPFASCVGKEQFDSAEKAMKTVKNHNKRKHRVVVAAYRCQHCGSYHLGTKRSGSRR